MHLLQHFKELTVRPKNAQELKGLILQLAIQGKLTRKWREENPDVEPASESLNRIKEEKEQLIKEKKIKREQELSVITEDEIPFQLPENWRWCKMLDFCYQITDGAHHTPKYVDSGIPFLSVKDLSKGFIDFSDTRFIEQEAHNELVKRCNPEYNDILLTKIGTTGIAKVIDTKQEFSLFVSVALLKIAKKDLFPFYIEYCINSPFIKDQSSEGTEGVGNKNLVLRKIKEFLVPLPPLEEQKAIVEVIEILFKEVEQLEQLTVERITLKEKFVVSALNQLTTKNTTKEWAFLQEHFHTFFDEKNNIKKLRETILQLAVQGKLTADWRANNPNIEDAYVLLKRIQKEKAQLIKDKKIKKENPLPAIAKDEIPYELPEGWVWCRFGDLITFLNGYAFKSSTYVPTSNYQIIRLGNVKNDNFLINTKEAYVPSSVGEDTLDYQLFENDILTTLTGTKNRRDYCFTCLVKEEHLDEKVLLLNQRVGCIRTIDKSASELINKFLKSDIILNQLFETETGTANQGNIGSTAFKNLIFPLPPLHEQKAIVEKVNALLDLFDALENEVKQSQKQSEKLMQSVLREVFETGNSL